ncbi:MAG TPA: DUF892 family protein [Caulobacteraceae bacterium]|jgi:ferritin-like metal-binding protein YciE|nr:DUF892 family protein [Caulobacteraceae bacterium]
MNTSISRNDAISQDEARKLFVAGLENIHAIQRDAKSMMLKVIDRLDHYPDARQRLQAHLKDKDSEMARAEQILDRMGEKPSGAKDSTFSFMGGATAAMTHGMEDDVLKTSMLTYGLANYEIAAYESLISIAGPAGQPDAKPLLEQSLSEEKAIAEWLHDHLEPTVMRYLELKSKGEKAAH